MVCGIEADGLSSWGGGMTTSFECLDAAGCGGSFSESGGGGGGDGVGEWFWGSMGEWWIVGVRGRVYVGEHLVNFLGYVLLSFFSFSRCSGW